MKLIINMSGSNRSSPFLKKKKNYRERRDITE